ncbi:MAG: hypothetical protein ACR2P7_05550 [bacterium]
MSADTIEDRIADARLKWRNRILAALALAIIALAGAVVYLSVQLGGEGWFPFNLISAPPREESAASTSNAPTPALAPSETSTATTTAATSTTAATEQIAQSDDDDDDDSSRQDFIRELAAYEAEVEPRIAALRLPVWADGKYAPEALKARAVERFAAHDYARAREVLREAGAVVAQAEADYAAQLATAKRAAREAFAADDAPRAEQSLREALRLDPQDAEMLALQPRVAALAQVLEQLRAADVANKENRPRKEVAALQRALALDPSRADIQSRLRALQAKVKAQRFAAAAGRAHDALQAGELNAAQQHLATARKISPDDAEVAALTSRLQRARIEREFAAEFALGGDATQRDDWTTAVAHFQRARQLKPNDKSAIEQHDAAQRIVVAARELESLLAQPHRLGDRAVHAAAGAYAREVEPLLGASAHLRERHRALLRAVAAYATEVPVVVVSDNATEIIVRGEGRVGKTLRRTIQLRPGRRVFEGSRLGYKSKLVELSIAPGAVGMEVSVICDERI